MRCLIRYQLREEELPAHHEFSAEQPDADMVIQHLTQFLHPEVMFEFLPVQADSRDNIPQLRARMAHAREYLEQYCGLKSLSYMVLPEGASSAQGRWTTLLLGNGESSPASATETSAR
ncbi:MAG TPA: hypothetical protein VE092_01365 [Herbaspirillum sp.]|uniref:hypothetical protein n=1 Tax=Herbaspirillum sp. TaxID=1890675 RepID=UPI002D49D78D|nr:hypothetical protein [Herbaspirillum sp.]HZG18635.1 hypothetical protein [Herbaspirillum sp.]